MADVSWIYPTAAATVTALLGWANRHSIKRAEQKVDGVHNEVRPPSNGTTNGAYQEGMSFGLAMGIPWIIEELIDIRHLLGSQPHSDPPDTSVFINPSEAPLPDRPKEQPWPPPRPPRNQAPPSTSQNE